MNGAPGSCLAVDCRSFRFFRLHLFRLVLLRSSNLGEAYIYTRVRYTHHWDKTYETMASRTAVLSLGLLLLSARTARATPPHKDLTFMAYEESYGYQTETSPSPEPTPTPDGGYGYQVSSTPDSTLPSISTPSPYAPTAPSSTPICTNSTSTITIPYSTSTSSTSHTCHNTTITSTIYPSFSTPSASPSRNCSKTTTTVTIPWPGTGTGYLPKGTGYAGGNAGWNGTTTYYAPTQGTNPPSYPTPEPPLNSTSNFELPETSSEAVQSSSAADYGGDTPTSTPTPEPAPQPQPEPSGNVPPAPPASSTGPDEPLFTGGAARYGSGVSLAVAVGALVAWL